MEGWRRILCGSGMVIAVATIRGSDSSAKERFVYHAAGHAGMGGSSYIDATVYRDREDNTAWTSAADGTLEQRRDLRARCVMGLWLAVRA